MPRDESLIMAYLLDGEGGGQKIGWDEIKQWSPGQGILWIHLNYTVRRAAQWLIKDSGLDKFVVKAMVAEESRPRSVVAAKGLLICLRGVNSNPGQDPEDMVSIRTWIDEHCIITTRKRHLLSIDDIRDAIEGGTGPKTPAEFLRLLSDRLLDRMSNVIESISDQVDELEEEVLTAESHLLRSKIADLRRQSISIKRYLAPQREALSKLYHENISLLSQTDQLHFREANDRVMRYIEDLDSARERAGITHEELSSRLSEQMDKRMYLLSVVAVIFLPLSFITGLLGVNVGGIPGANDPTAFLIVSSGLLLILLSMLWWLRRKQWI